MSVRLTVGVYEDEGFVHPGEFVVDDVFEGGHPVRVLREDGRIETVLGLDVLEIPERLIGAPGVR